MNAAQRFNDATLTMDSDLLKMLCCPETRQELHAGEPLLIEKLNRLIAGGSLRNRAGHPVKERLDGGLVRADGKLLYPVHQNIPVMLMDEAIPVDPAAAG